MTDVLRGTQKGNQMITSATLDILSELRREHCNCGAIMQSPQFHESSCPYKPLGEAEIKKAEDRD